MSRRRRHSGSQTNIAFVGQSNTQLAANIGLGVGVGIGGEGVGQGNLQFADNSAAVIQSNR